MKMILQGHGSAEVLLHALFCFLQIQELETENAELKKQLQELEEQLMISPIPPVRGAAAELLKPCASFRLKQLLFNRHQLTDRLFFLSSESERQTKT